MLYIDLTIPALARPLPFFLALEQWLARRYEGQEVMFTWQVRPTVICGRHQCMEAEVDLCYCRAHGIDVVRRRSGGGCVYADPDNLMISFVAPVAGRPAQDVFRTYAEHVAHMLRELGVEAQAQGRNDITIDGRKVSGFAYYQPSPVMAIAHGTMLFRADTETMARAITPGRAKLAGRGVQSVASRITTLAAHAPDLTIDAFLRALRSSMPCMSLTLSPAEEAEVEAIAAEYRDEAWVAGRRLSASTFTRSARVEGVGTLRIDASVSDGIITAAAITGDFLCPDGNPREIEQSLIGQRIGSVSVPSTAAISGLLPGQLEDIINSQP